MSACPLVGCDLDHDVAVVSGADEVAFLARDGEFVCLCITCPHHPELLLGYLTNARYAQDNAEPRVFSVAPRGRFLTYVVTEEKAVEYESGRLSSSVPVYRGAKDDSHVVIYLRCPRPSCSLDAVFTRAAERRIQSVVRALWADGHRGYVTMTTAQLGI